MLMHGNGMKTKKTIVHPSSPLPSSPLSIPPASAPTSPAVNLSVARGSGFTRWQVRDLVWVDGALVAQATKEKVAGSPSSKRSKSSEPHTSGNIDEPRPTWPGKVVKVTQDELTIELFGLPSARQVSEARDSQRIYRLRESKPLFTMFRDAGLGNRNWKRQFQSAMDSVYVFEEESDDEFDASFDILLPKKRRKSEEAISANSSVLQDSDDDFQTPVKATKKQQLGPLDKGAVVLAAVWIGERKRYQPAKIVDFSCDYKNNTHYSVELWDGRIQNKVARSNMITPDSPEFCTCQLSETLKDYMKPDPTYRDPELEAMVDGIKSHLRAVFEGKVETQRSIEYNAGGKRRAAMHEQNNLGYFNVSEHDFISRHVRKLFDEEIKTTQGDGLRFTEALNFVMSVVVPEAAIKCIEQKEGCVYEDAEKKLTEPHWASQILALREATK